MNSSPIQKRTAPVQELCQVASKNLNIKDFVINWSRRAGKTHFAVNEIIKPAALQIENCRVVYITSTLKHAKDILWQQLLDTFGPAIVHRNVGEGKMKVRNQYGGESIIQLMGWQTIDTIRGTHQDVVIYDETQLLGDFFSNHNTAVMPTMATTKGRRFYLFTPLGFNHAFELMQIAKENPNWYYTEADWTHFKHIDEEFIENEKNRMTEAQFGQEYECKYIKPDGLVLDAFDNDIHIFSGDIDKRITENSIVECGLDFGYGSGNTAIIKANITTREDGKPVYWITHEVYKRGSELQTYQIGQILAEMNPKIIFADSADPTRVNDLTRHNLPIEPVAKFNNYKAGLISRVNQAIKQDRVFIHESLRNILSEINMWFWDVGKTDIIRPDRSTKHDAIDAMLYLVGSHEEGVKVDRLIKPKKKKLKRYKPLGI